MVDGPNPHTTGMIFPSIIGKHAITFRYFYVSGRARGFVGENGVREHGVGSRYLS